MKLCKTHRKLVRSGSVTCTIDLAGSPSKKKDPTVIDFDPADVAGSVHWGQVGDFSGIRTPPEISSNSSVESGDSKGSSIKLPPPFPKALRKQKNRHSSTDPYFLGKLQDISAQLENVTLSPIPHQEPLVESSSSLLSDVFWTKGQV